MPLWIKCWHGRRIKHIWMEVFTEHRPFPLNTNHCMGLKFKSLVNICRPKTITKASAATTTHLCSDATSITLVMSVEKKSQDLRPEVGRGSSRLVQDDASSKQESWMPPWIKCWQGMGIKHIWMQVFTENRPFPLKTNHYKGLKRKSLVNICRPKTIIKGSATTPTCLGSDTISITLVMSVEKKLQDPRLSSEIHASCEE